MYKGFVLAAAAPGFLVPAWGPLLRVTPPPLHHSGSIDKTVEEMMGNKTYILKENK